MSIRPIKTRRDHARAPTPSRTLRLLLTVPRRARPVVSAALFAHGAGGIEEQEGGGRGRVRLVLYGAAAELERFAEAARQAGGAHVHALVGELPAKAAGWETRWTEDLGEIRVSRTLVIRPVDRARSGAAPPVAASRARRGPAVILLERAPAFGFGEHPTTLLATSAVERACRQGARTVLDVGTGTGVLAIAACLSGARRAVGVDLDARAVAAARRNAARSGVSSRVRFHAGRLSSRIRGRFHLVVANLDLRTLGALAESLAARVAPGGTLLLAGILAEDAPAVERRYAALGLRARRPVLRAAAGGDSRWALVRLVRPAGR